MPSRRGSSGRRCRTCACGGRTWSARLEGPMPSDRVVLSLDEFRERVLRSAPIPDDVVLHKATTFRAKLIAGDPRAVQLTISDATVDRDADSLAVEGWDTGHY